MFFEDDKAETEQAAKTSDFFLFLHTIHKHSLQLQYLDLVLYSVTLFEMIYLQFQSSGIIPITVVIPNELAYTMLGICSLILGLTVIGIVYNLKFPHLKDAHKLFRYLFYLPISLYCWQSLESSHNFGVSIGFLFAIITMAIFMIIVNLYFLDEDFTDVKSVQPLGLTMSIFEMIVLASSVIRILVDFCLVIKLVASVYLVQKVDTDYNPRKIEIRFYKIVSKLYFLLYVVMIFKKMALLENPIILMSLAVGLVIIILCECIEYNINRTEEFEYQIGRVSSMEFTSHIRRLLTLVEESRVEIKTRNTVSRPLISYLLQHQKYCKLADCELKKDQIDPIGMILSPDKYFCVLERLYAEIDLMVSRRKAAQPDNFDILSCSLHLCMVMNHKSVCYELMKYAKSVTVSLRLRYYIFTLEKGLQSLERIEQRSVEGLKFDQIVSQFKNSMQAVLRRIMQFWHENQQDAIDIQHTISIASKIRMAKKEVAQLWSKIARLQTMTTLHILRAYITLMTFINEHEDAYQLQKDFRNMHSSIVLSKTFRYIVGEDFCHKQQGVAVVTVTSSHLGTIDYCNRYLANIFGFTQKDLSQKRINALMPELVNRVHDSFLKEIIANPTKLKEDCTNWDMMGKHKNGYLFPIYMELKKSVIGGEIKFMAVIRKLKQSFNEMYFLTDDAFRVLDLTPRFDKMNVQNAKKRDISHLFTALNQIDLKAISQRKDNTIPEVQVELRHKLYLANITVSQVNFRKNNCGYKFSFLLSPLKCRIERVKQQGGDNIFAFTWRYNEQMFEGGDWFENEAVTWSSERNRESLQKTLSEKGYGEGIRPVLYFDGRFKRLDDWGFDSEIQSFNDQFEATQDLANSSDCKGLMLKFIQKHIGKLLYIVILAYAAMMVYYLYTTLLTTWSNQSKVTKNLNRYRVKCSSSIVVIKELMETKLGWESGLVDDYEGLVEKIQRYLVDSEMMDEVKYQRLQKLLYLRQSFDFTEFIDPENLRFNLEQLEISESMPLFVLMALSFSLGLIYYLNIKVFDNQLMTVMAIFLNLQESTLKSLSHSCVQQIRRVDNLDEQQDSNLVSHHFQDQNSIRKKRIKKIKSQSSYFVCDMIKVGVLLSSLLIYLGMVIYFQDAQEVKLQSIFAYSQETFNINRQGSEVIIGRLNQRVYGVPYVQPGYRVDYLEYFPLQQKWWSSDQINRYFYSDACVQFPASSRCTTISHGIMQFGVNKALNSFLQSFSSNSFESPLQFIELTQLFSFYISPIYNRIVDQAESRMYEQISSKFVYSMSLVCPLLAVILIDAIVIGLQLRKKRREVAQLVELVRLVPQGIIDEEVPVQKVRGYVMIREGEL